MKTSELIGPALDWAVAKCEGLESYASAYLVDDELVYLDEASESTWEPSIYWGQGGPIIEREKISVQWDPRVNEWVAVAGHEVIIGLGPTPLIAAMRCYVASRLGDEIEIPEELIMSANEWRNLPTLANVAAAQAAGDEIQFRSHETYEWRSWSGKTWDKDWLFSARPAQPKTVKVKILCWYDGGRMHFVRETWPVGSDWIRIPEQDIEIEVPDGN